MSEQSETSIMDVVSESRYQATFALRAYFGSESLEVIEDWVPVIVAMQALPAQFIDEVAMPIITRFFEEENLDPKSSEDRKKAAPFVPVISSSINTAAQAVFQQIQVQQQQKQKMKPKLLGGNMM